jgi:hypothetical protein
MERAMGPRRIATSAGFLLAALAVLWSLYVLVMPPLFADITGSSSPGTRGLSWLIGAAYALPSILCAAAGAIGAVVIGRGRALPGGVLVALGWACFAVAVAVFVAPSWLA